MKWLFNKENVFLPPFNSMGVQAIISEGVGATKTEPHGADSGWFSGDHTIILGNSNQLNKDNPEGTVATWKILIEPQTIALFAEGYLTIACERRLGGLHSMKRGSIARLSVNGIERDTIGLKHKPDGHSDYFHRIPHPKILHKIWPIKACGTVYSWPIHKHQLSQTGIQTIQIQVAPEVSWDIDYVSITLKINKQEYKPWVKWAVAVILGAIITEIIHLFFQ